MIFSGKFSQLFALKEEIVFLMFIKICDD